MVSAASTDPEQSKPSAIKRSFIFSPSGCLASAGHLTILSGDDGLHGVRANRPRAQRKAIPAGLSAEVRAYVHTRARSYFHDRENLRQPRLRSRPPRGAQAAELRRVRSAFPRAQLARHL